MSLLVPARDRSERCIRIYLLSLRRTFPCGESPSYMDGRVAHMHHLQASTCQEKGAACFAACRRIPRHLVRIANVKRRHRQHGIDPLRGPTNAHQPCPHTCARHTHLAARGVTFLVAQQPLHVQSPALRTMPPLPINGGHRSIPMQLERRSMRGAAREAETCTRCASSKKLNIHGWRRRNVGLSHDACCAIAEADGGLYSWLACMHIAMLASGDVPSV